MTDSYITFKWTLNKITENTITEKIPLHNYESYLSEHGTIAEEIFSACALKSIAQKSNFFAFDPRELFPNPTMDWENKLRKCVNDYFLQENLTKDNFITINFDLLGKIAFGYVYAVCEQAEHGIKNTSETDIVIRAFNDISALTLSPDNNKDTWIKTLDSPNEEIVGLEKFNELIQAIKNSNIKKDYIKTTGTRKCIALYKKWARQEFTVAFSGHYDCESEDLYAFFDVKDQNKRYEDYLKIANAIGAELAGTSKSVSRYAFGGDKNNMAVRYGYIKEVLSRSKRDDDYYSCCERKIFAFLDDNKGVYSGKLFVKYPPCQECTISILHHLILQGKLFSMFVGLPID